MRNSNLFESITFVFFTGCSNHNLKKTRPTLMRVCNMYTENTVYCIRFKSDLFAKTPCLTDVFVSLVQINNTISHFCCTVSYLAPGHVMCLTVSPLLVCRSRIAFYIQAEIVCAWNCVMNKKKKKKMRT